MTWSRYSPKSAGPPARVQLGQVGLPGDGRPWRCHGHAQHQAPHRACLGVADERPDQHQAADQARPLRGGQDRGPGAHGVAHHHGRAAEFPDQGKDIASGFLIAVGRERGIAVAVAAKIGAGHPVTRSPQGRSQETVAGPQVTHARHQHHQGAGTCDVVTDPPLRTAEITGFPGGRHEAGIAGARRMVRCGAHAFIAFGLGLASLPGGGRGHDGGEHSAGRPERGHRAGQVRDSSRWPAASSRNSTMPGAVGVLDDCFHHGPLGHPGLRPSAGPAPQTPGISAGRSCPSYACNRKLAMNC